MARAALASLGPAADALLAADLTHIWAAADAAVDAEETERDLRAALALEPGRDRDARLTAALAAHGELLADEPYADWALRPRERLESLRQEARLTLARDRSRGAGQARPEAVLAAWEACFEHDPAAEEAAGALVRAYFTAGHRDLAVRAYQRCRAALGELGVGLSPWLEEVYATAAFEAVPSRSAFSGTGAPGGAPREELRTVSVLSAEVVPPGALDPERLRDAVGRGLAAVIAAAEALGGTVTAVSGHGVQAVFGAPEAHEDDPERAARAAFRALSDAARSDAALAEPPVTLRIGLETGPAVLGPVGGGGRVEYGAVGEVVSRAAALQALARPGSALVGPVTRAAVGSLFTWGEPVPIGLPAPGTEPDPAAPTATYLGEPRSRSAARPRPAALPRRGPLVGRTAELTALGTALREAVRGRGSVVAVTGEPGLGKTRLVHECRRRAPAGTVWLEGRCASYASSTPYSLYQQLLAGWAGVPPDQPERVIRPALERLLATVGGRDVIPLLARMMGLPAGAALGRMSPGELQRATFAAWRSVVTRLVAAAPVVLVLEDLHWADPTSLRLTLDLAGLAPGRRLLILATSRTPWEGPVRRVELRPLPGAAEEELARSLIGALSPGARPAGAGGAGASPEVLQAVLASADGNPLFLEERLAALLETRALVRERDGWRLSPAPGPPVPQVLERLVRARVDRLSPAARDAIRPASVLGTEFGLSLLNAVCDPCLATALDELCERDLLRQVAGEPEPVYRFRHALIQEAVYHSLLGAERRLLHGRAAWALEAAAAGRTEDVAAVLGRHFAAAGEAALALRYYEQAGDHATDAFANDEALASFRAALDLASGPDVAGEPEAGNTAADLLAKLANVLWRTGQRAAARDAFTEALRLARDDDTTDSRRRRAHLLIRLGRLEEADGDHVAAWAAFDAAEPLLGGYPEDLDTATSQEWLELMVDGRVCQYINQYQPELALATLASVRGILNDVGTPALTYSFYLHLVIARVMRNRYQADRADLANLHRALAAATQSEEKDAGYALYFTGQFLWLLGDLADAEEYLERALAMAGRIGESALHGWSLLGLALTALRRHDAGRVRALLPRVLAVADAMAPPDYLAGVMSCQAWLAWQDGHRDDVIKLSGEIAAAMTKPQYPWAYHCLLHQWPLVAAHLDAGDVAAAIAAARDFPRYAPPLPAALGEALAAAITRWDPVHPDPAGIHLAAALTQARDLGYL